VHEKLAAPTGSPEADTRTLANGISIEVIINEVKDTNRQRTLW
jgi:hypothetical protein